MFEVEDVKMFEVDDVNAKSSPPHLRSLEKAVYVAEAASGMYKPNEKLLKAIYIVPSSSNSNQTKAIDNPTVNPNRYIQTLSAGLGEEQFQVLRGRVHHVYGEN